MKPASAHLLRQRGRTRRFSLLRRLLLVEGVCLRVAHVARHARFRLRHLGVEIYLSTISRQIMCFERFVVPIRIKSVIALPKLFLCLMVSSEPSFSFKCVSLESDF